MSNDSPEKKDEEDEEPEAYFIEDEDAVEIAVNYINDNPSERVISLKLNSFLAPDKALEWVMTRKKARRLAVGILSVLEKTEED